MDQFDSILQNMLYSYCSIACMHLLRVFTQMYNWALQTVGVGGFYLLQSHRLHVFLVFPHTEGLRHKSWWVFPAEPLIQLWLYFRMPSWSAAVPRISAFPPPFPATLCLMLDSFRELQCCFFSLQACCDRWSDTQQSCGICLVAHIKNWHSTLAFPGCPASSGVLEVV